MKILRDLNLYKVKNNKAFSLLEMGFFITIIAIIAFPLFEYMFALQRVEQYKNTREKMRKIHDAITQYYSNSANQLLPAPADMMLPINHAAYGQAMTASFNTVSTTSKNIYYGSVPVDALNLTIEDSLDAWGNKFSYFVSQGAVNINDYTGDANDLNVINFDLKSSPDNSIIYTIISHGEDGYGAYDKNGNQISYDSASDNEKRNIYENSKIITSSTPIILSSGSINDIAYGYKKNDILANYYTINDQLGYSTKGDAFRIDSSTQNIGIGTTSPANSSLVVAGRIASNANDQIAVNFGVNNNDETMIKLVSAASSSSFIDFNKTNSASDFKGRISYDNANDSLNFYTSSNNTPKMTITSDGKVGIGNLNPIQKLDVNGWIVAGGGSGIYFTSNSGKRNESYIQYYRESGDNTRLRFMNGYDCEDDIEFYQANAPRLTIECDINVNAQIETNSDIFAGNAVMTDDPHGSSYMTLGHRSSNNSSGYAFMQHSNGTSYLNATNGRTFNFRINNGTQMYYDGNFKIIDGKRLDITNQACYSYGCDGTFVRRYGNLQLYVDDWVYLNDKNNGWTQRIRWNSYYGLYSYRTYSSDKRLKENIKPMESVIERFSKLRARIYDHKKNDFLWNEDDISDNYNKYGFIAQEVQKLFPEFVANNEHDNFLNIDGSKFPAITIMALKESKEQKDLQIKQLKKKIKSLDKRLRKLERKKIRFSF
ncbi:MAG: tail fiber domain-containing protein [Rickettsiales bacterium]|nr:tail fiber domain-containing protein [Rickettsiales bacterium]